VVGRGAAGKVWSARLNTYELELWDTVGARQARITRIAQWFRPWVITRGQPTEKPPQPTVVAVSQVGTLLWVVVRVAARDWAPQKYLTYQGHAGYISDEQREQAHESVVEVFDLERGVLLASQRFSESLSGFVGEGLVVSYGRARHDNSVYAVSRLTLRR
jgi:hypothetical protein